MPCVVLLYQQLCCNDFFIQGVLRWDLEVSVVCLQGRIALLQRGGLPLQGEDLSLLVV